MTPWQLARQVDSRQYTQLLAFESVDPSGEERQDIRLAMLCHLIATVFGAQTKMGDFLLDFIPDPPQRKQYESWAQLAEQYKKDG